MVWAGALALESRQPWQTRQRTGWSGANPVHTKGCIDGARNFLPARPSLRRPSGGAGGGGARRSRGITLKPAGVGVA